MIRIHSISARLVIAIALIAAGGCAIVGALAIRKQAEGTELALQREMTVQYQSVLASFDAEGRSAAALARRSRVVGAVRLADGMECLFVLSAACQAGGAALQRIRDAAADG